MKQVNNIGKIIHIYVIVSILSLLMFPFASWISDFFGVSSLVYAFLSCVGLSNRAFVIASLVWFIVYLILFVSSYIVSIVKKNHCYFAIVTLLNAIAGVFFMVIKIIIDNYIYFGAMIFGILLSFAFSIYLFTALKKSRN